MPYFLANIEDPEAQDRNRQRLLRAAAKACGLDLNAYARAQVLGQPAPGPPLAELVPLWAPDRCYVCGAPVADDSGVRLRVVENAAEEQHAATEAEAAGLIALGWREVEIARIGPDCYRRHKADLEPYVVESFVRSRGRPRTHPPGRRAQDPERSRGPTATAEDAELVARIPSRSMAATAKALAPGLKRAATGVRAALAAAMTAGKGRSLSAPLRAALAAYLEARGL